MLAEILLVLAGHDSSLFPADNKLHPDFVPLLHPGERQCLESLGLLASRYRKIKDACQRLSNSPSLYICAFCAKLNEILKDEYESLIVDTESKILCKDASYVGQGSFVPLSSIRAVFSQWDSPLAALESLMMHLEESPSWSPGSLIDLLLARAETGIYRVSSLMTSLAEAVQRIWRAQLQAFLVHGVLSPNDPLASEDYVLYDSAVPACVSPVSRESIMYIGRAIATVKRLKWHRQIPGTLSLSHVKLLDSALPQDKHAFEGVIAQIRAEISEWLWSNVLTLDDVEDAVDSLANYFLLQNGEFCLSLIREIDRLKLSRLSVRSGPRTMIREQDLHLALLRASLGTLAQHDPNLSRLRFQLPEGPVRPLLPSLPEHGSSTSETPLNNGFDDILLGTTMKMTYNISWPLDLFLDQADLTIYAELFAFLSSLRHVQTRIHTCWTSLSNAQRIRRRWTGLDEGGTADSEARKGLLRCGWGVVKLMGWFLDVLLEYLMIDVVESEYRKFKALLRTRDTVPGSSSIRTLRSLQSADLPSSSTLGSFKPSLSKEDIGTSDSTRQLDFTTLRSLHTTYLQRLISGSLLTNPLVTVTIRKIIEVCERFMALVERWGGDVLPALLFEGSIASGSDNSVGELVRERSELVQEIDKDMKSLLETFFDQLSSQPSNFIDTSSKHSLLNSTSGFHTFLGGSHARQSAREWDGETRRHVERLLLRLDFNRMFSRAQMSESHVPDGPETNILREGGLI